LQGRTILIVEDEFFQAREMKAVLEGAGARVIGPVEREADAKALLAEGKVDAALLDINLGGAPNYATAEILHQEGIPFAFLTGYDPGAIPRAFASVPRLSKPANDRLIIRELSSLF
jgi:CheY-like chemotaxis protein